MGKLDGKVALITGAGSGIGRATAILFAKEGAKVMVADISPECGQETIRMINEGGGDATFVAADVSKAGDAEKMVNTTLDTYGSLDILYNNAGIQGPFSPAANYAEDDWDAVLSTNLKGVFLGSKYAIPVMLKQGAGVIINTTSTAGIIGLPYVAAYAASKGGVIQLSKSLAVELAPQNIRVNCICPGGTQTAMMAAWLPADPAEREAFLRGMPGGRPIQPEEIARAALFLASDDSTAAIGSVLVVDLGHTVA